MYTHNRFTIFCISFILHCFIIMYSYCEATTFPISRPAMALYFLYFVVQSILSQSSKGETYRYAYYYEVLHSSLSLSGFIIVLSKTTTLAVPKFCLMVQ